LTLLYVGNEEEIVAELAWLDSDVVRVADIDGARRYLQSYGGDEQFLIAYGPTATLNAIAAGVPAAPLEGWGASIVLVHDGTDGDIWRGRAHLGAAYAVALPEGWRFLLSLIEQTPVVPLTYCLN
jgi:hypothetical protein